MGIITRRQWCQMRTPMRNKNLFCCAREIQAERVCSFVRCVYFLKCLFVSKLIFFYVQSPTGVRLGKYSGQCSEYPFIKAIYFLIVRLFHVLFSRHLKVIPKFVTHTSRRRWITQVALGRQNPYSKGAWRPAIVMLVVFACAHPLFDWRRLRGLSVAEAGVCKVVTERAYSISWHPSSAKLLVAVGDKVCSWLTDICHRRAREPSYFDSYV